MIAALIALTVAELVVCCVLLGCTIRLMTLCKEAQIGGAGEDTETESRKSREMDEGFDNLMTYTVKLDRGRMTGGEP